jgi:hypothetical protein
MTRKRKDAAGDTTATDESPRTGISRGHRPKRKDNRKQALSNTLAARQGEKKKAGGKFSTRPALKQPRQRVYGSSEATKGRKPFASRPAPPKTPVRASMAADTRHKKGGKVSAATQSRPAVSRSFYTQHAKPIRDPATGKYFCVKPARATAKAARPYPHRFMTTHTAASAPTPKRGGGGAFSSRYDLYLFHKANGTLALFYRMFGLD